jgi:ABC-type molybdate transport system substrate-binding protein
MSEENNKPSGDEQKQQPVPLAEILINTAMKYSQDNPVTLADMCGHFEVAKIQIYERAMTQARQQLAASAPPAGPAGDAGTEGTEGASRGEAEDKA